MSVLFLDFEGSERNTRVQKLARTGAHIVASEPRWPAFFELAKREKPYAIAIDFAQAPSHSLETADYLAKAKDSHIGALVINRRSRFGADREALRRVVQLCKLNPEMSYFDGVNEVYLPKEGAMPKRFPIEVPSR